MKFETEIELINVLRSTLKENYSRKSVSIFEEVSLGYGIADMVLSILKEDFRENLHKKELNMRDINIYNLIVKIPHIKIIEILNITRISKSCTKESLNKLMANGYIILNDKGYIVSYSYELPFSLNFAIEAKLRALKQAYRYKWFAEYSYVVLDEYNSRSAKNNIHIFEKYNIGLATINKLGELKRYFKPVIEKPLDIKMQMLLSEKITQNQLFAK